MCERERERESPSKQEMRETAGLMPSYCVRGQYEKTLPWKPSQQLCVEIADSFSILDLLYFSTLSVL